MKTKNQKGITLIALIITIIVMMILVAVSVTVALQSGLFSATSKAARDTREKAEKENELAAGKVTVEGTEYNSIQEYIDTLGSGSGKAITFKFYGREYTVKEGTTWGNFVQTFESTGYDFYGHCNFGISSCDYQYRTPSFYVIDGHIQCKTRQEHECGGIGTSITYAALDSSTPVLESDVIQSISYEALISI